MAFFLRCAGVLACIALASLPASSCPCCRHCAGIVAKLAFDDLAGTALAFASVVLAFCLHCAGVIASIVLLLLLPALRQRCCPRCVGVFALIAHPLWWCPPFHRHCRTWCPCHIQCRLCLYSVFCCLTPSQQCTCLCHDIVVGASHGSCHRLGHNHPLGNSRVCRLEPIGDSQLCCLRFDLVEADTTMCFLDGGDP
jgi:hypothetical protein